MKAWGRAFNHGVGVMLCINQESSGNLQEWVPRLLNREMVSTVQGGEMPGVTLRRIWPLPSHQHRLEGKAFLPHS